MITFMLCFATIVMMAIGLGAVAVIFGIAIHDVIQGIQK